MNISAKRITLAAVAGSAGLMLALLLPTDRTLSQDDLPTARLPSADQPVPQPLGLQLGRPPVAAPTPTVTVPTGNGHLVLTAVGKYGVVYTDSSSPESAALEAKTQELVGKLKEIKDEGQRRPLIAELTKVVSEQFNLRQKQREQELQQLEEQLKKLRSIQERREGAREEIIDDRVRQLVKESEGLHWATGAIPASAPPMTEAVVTEDGRANPGFPGRMAVTTRPSGLISSSMGSMAASMSSKQNETIKIFHVGSEVNTKEFVELIEHLLGNQANVKLIPYNNRIVAKGNVNDLAMIEALLLKLSEEQGDGVRPSSN